MSNSTARPATASDVRKFYADPTKGAARVAALKHPESVLPGARGRLHPEVIAGYNKGKPEARRYVTGSTLAANAKAKAEAEALRAQAVKAGLTVGSRGPLSKEAQKALGIKPTKRVRKG